MLADGLLAGQLRVPVAVARRGDEDGVVGKECFLDERGGARELGLARTAEETLQIGQAENAATRPVQRIAHGLQVVIQQLRLRDAHEAVDAPGALAPVY